MKIKSTLLVSTLLSVVTLSANAQTAPSIFLDEAIPHSRPSALLFQALKANKISELYIRPRKYKKVTRPAYRITYANDFETCTSFDDQRTLYQDIVGYKLSAEFFDREASLDLFLSEINSADFVNGECLLGAPVDAPAADYHISLISPKSFDAQISVKDQPPIPIDKDITKILEMAGVNLEEKPRYKPIESNIGKVSDANIIRALKSESDTLKQTALYLLNNRDKPYGNEYVILEPTKSREVLTTLLAMDYLRSTDEVTRASVLNAIGLVMEERDSAKVKLAIISALEAQYPLKIERSSRDFGKRFGIEFPPDGELRAGHQSQKILLGAAVPIFRMSESDRNAILIKYPDSFEKFYKGTYKSMKPTRLLRDLSKN